MVLKVKRMKWVVGSIIVGGKAVAVKKLFYECEHNKLCFISCQIRIIHRL